MQSDLNNRLLKMGYRSSKLLVLFCLMGMVLTACFKEDEKVPPHIAGDVKMDTAAMTPLYKNQVFYDLGTGSAVSTVLKTDWDLGFASDSNGVRIILNSSNFMKAADMGIVPIGFPADTSGVTWKFDKSDGNPDSSAIMGWIIPNGSDTTYSRHLFVIDRGMDEQGNLRGLRQVIFDSLKGNTFYFRFSNYNGTGLTSFSVSKQPGRNFAGFSFASGGQVKQVEPLRSDWDLKFTQYTTLLFTDLGEAYPYLVTGVLINPYKVAVAIDETNAFQDIKMANVSSYTFSSAEDQIGYDWKFYSFESGSYTVVTNKTYIIRDTEGFYFKLRFVSFYNQAGEKGYPVFEFQEL